VCFADPLGGGDVATVGAGSSTVAAPDGVGEGTNRFEVSYAGRIEELDSERLGDSALHGEVSDVVRFAEWL
jgi:hypothetical protein